MKILPLSRTANLTTLIHKINEIIDAVNSHNSISSSLETINLVVEADVPDATPTEVATPKVEVKKRAGRPKTKK